MEGSGVEKEAKSATRLRAIKVYKIKKASLERSQAIKCQILILAQSSRGSIAHVCAFS